MAASGIENTKVKIEECCGYCLKQLPYMEDPRLLPCSHLFCMPCLRVKARQNGGLKCMICSRSHGTISLEKLPKALNTSESDDSRQESMTSPCDVCDENKSPSVCYCPQCMKNICEQHLKAHEVFLGSTHSVVFHKPDELTSMKCADHLKENVTKACNFCCQMFCRLCNTDHPCKTATDAKHEVVKLDQLAERLKGQVNDVLKALSEKITELCKQERSAWNDADDMKEKVQQLTKEVDRVADQQILQVTKKAQCLKAELRNYLTKMVDATESRTAKLSSRAECIQRLWKSTRKLSMKSNAGVVKSHAQMFSKETKDFLTWVIPQAEHTMKDLIYSPPLPGNLLSIKSLTTLESKCPSLLKSLGTMPLSSVSSVLLDHEKIIVSCFTANSPTCSYNTKFEVIQRFTDCRVIVAFAALPREGFGQYRYLVVIEEDDSRKQGGRSARVNLEMLTEDFSIRKQIDRYPNSTYNDRRFGIAVHPLTSQIIAVNAQRSHATVYDRDGDFQLNVEISSGMKSNPTDIKVLPDGAIILFFENSSTFGKFELNSDTKTLQSVWLVANLPSLAGMSLDADGYIYVSSKSKSCIYIISPAGKTMTTLFHQKLKDTGLKIIDVFGSFIAVVTQSELHLMQLVKEG